MSNSRRYSSSGNRPGGVEKSTRVTDLRSKRGEENAGSGQHVQTAEDSVVDACVDHAHAVARVHGAPEVMLEHLVHALARVPEAAGVLEELGLDVDTIRRESAAIIAADIPVGEHDSKRELYVSNEFTAVLHLAAANASRQGEAEISVWDLVEAISGFDDGLAAVRLLNQGASSSSSRHNTARRDGEPRRRDRARYERTDRNRPAQQFASSSFVSNVASDELLQQGLAAIETALHRQSAPQVQSDPRLDEKFELLDARMSGLLDHRDREINDLKELIASIGGGRESEQTRAVHADLIALREAVEMRDKQDNSRALHAELAELREAVEMREKQDNSRTLHAEIASLRASLDSRDNELRDATAHLGHRLDAVKEDVGLIAADPQAGLRDEIRALSERIDGSGSKEVANLSTSFNKRFVNMETLFDTRQGEMVGLHSNLGKGVDEQGARLRGLEARLKDEHDQTQDELRAIRGFLEKIAISVDGFGEQIDRLRLDHIGDMSVVSNQLEDIYWHVYQRGRSGGASSLSDKTGNGHGPAALRSMPSKKFARPRKSSLPPQGQGRIIPTRDNLSAGGSQSDDIFEYQAPAEKKLVIDAETTQHVARRFAGKTRDGRDARSPHGSTDHGQARVDRDDNGDRIVYRGKKIRRTRSSAKQVNKGKSLRDRLLHRGAQIKDQYKSGSMQKSETSEPGSEGPPNWGRRFWDDVKGLFRDDDPRWTDWRK